MKQLIKILPKSDWQYLIPFLMCLVSFIATDIFGIIEKQNLAYWSGILIFEPYRVVTSHFIHADAQHLLANTLGLIIARYCLKKLNLANNYFLLLLIGFLIPLQIFIFWFVDIFIFQNKMSFAIGFSGVIYGMHSFILLSAIYGKKNFMWINIGLQRNSLIRQNLIVLTAIGLTWSLLPGISLIGHISGLIGGGLLFLL